MSHQELKAYCLAKPGAWQDEPWGGDHVAKVSDKIFAFLGSDDGTTIGLKCGRSAEDRAGVARAVSRRRDGDRVHRQVRLEHLRCRWRGARRRVAGGHRRLLRGRGEPVAEVAAPWVIGPALAARGEWAPGCGLVVRVVPAHGRPRQSTSGDVGCTRVCTVPCGQFLSLTVFRSTASTR